MPMGRSGDRAQNDNTTDRKRQRPKNAQEHDRAYLRLIFKPVVSEVTDEEVRYYSEHPDEIDEITAPVNVHKAFLWIGALLGHVLCRFLQDAQVRYPS